MCIRFNAKVEIIPCAFDTTVAAYDKCKQKHKNECIFYLCHITFIILGCFKTFCNKIVELFLILEWIIQRVLFGFHQNLCGSLVFFFFRCVCVCLLSSKPLNTFRLKRIGIPQMNALKWHFEMETDEWKWILRWQFTPNGAQFHPHHFHHCVNIFRPIIMFFSSKKTKLYNGNSKHSSV